MTGISGSLRWRRCRSRVDLIGKAAEERKLSAIVACDEAFHQLIVAEAASRRLLRTWKNFEGENAAIYYTMNRYGLMPMDYFEAKPSVDCGRVQRAGLRKDLQVCGAALYGGAGRFA
jgi:hypothetical protein